MADIIRQLIFAQIGKIQAIAIKQGVIIPF
jgi:hypothetical protein